MSRAFSSPYLSLDVQDQVWLNTPMQCHMQVCMGSQGPARCCACSALVGLNGNNAVSAVRYKWLYTWQKRGIAAPCLCKRTAHCSSPLPPPTASSPGPCWVSLGESWDFPSQPVKVETMNNSVTKHLCKEEQASTCREVLCMQLHVHSALLPEESSRDLLPLHIFWKTSRKIALLLGGELMCFTTAPHTALFSACSSIQNLLFETWSLFLSSPHCIGEILPTGFYWYKLQPFLLSAVWAGLFFWHHFLEIHRITWLSHNTLLLFAVKSRLCVFALCDVQGNQSALKLEYWKLLWEAIPCITQTWVLHR